MALAILAILGFTAAVNQRTHAASTLSVEAHHFGYGRKEIGDFQLPQIPHKDQHPTLVGRVPPPEAAPLSLLQVGEDPAGAKKPAPGMRSAANPIGSKVPANWFGRGVYTSPNFEISSGKDECDVCKYMIGKYTAPKPHQKEEFIYNAPGAGPAPAPAPAAPAPGSPPPAGMEFKKLINNIDLCDGINPKYQEMCDGFEEYLINCPSFTNDVCHRDEGGAERLVSPCPDYLKCYYCLRINPLYCLSE